MKATDIDAIPESWREWCLNCAEHLSDKDRAKNSGGNTRTQMKERAKEAVES